MDLKSGYPFWPIRNGLLYAFPPLEHDLRCDVLIVGAGITGALIARSLASAGLDVVVVDERDIAWGSTAASTALLQYEIDTHLTALRRWYGPEAAAAAYLACRDAVSEFHAIAEQVGDVDFAVADSLYVASSRWDRAAFRTELQARIEAGLDAMGWKAKELRSHYGVRAYAGMLNKPAARVDPYRFTSRLLKQLGAGGTRIFDRTRIARWKATGRGVVAFTELRNEIKAEHLIIAAGYASQKYLRQRIASNRSSYAFVTDALKPETLGPWANTLLWESARPYLYMRPTSDNRLIIGGEDDAVDIPARRDLRLGRKVKALQKRLHRLLPDLDTKPAFAWAGTFAETKDGLPYFGPEPKGDARILYAMAYGGNGITYSVIGASLVRDRILGKPSSFLYEFFSFERSRTGRAAT